ncbi:MAG: Histidine kinase [Burkholderia sp.]|nr:Histidine kinase [Burkholderia sp.]
MNEPAIKPADKPADKPARRRREFGLLLKINLLLGALTCAALAVFITQEIHTTRSSIREEMEASNRVATQLLGRITAIYARQAPWALAEVLRETGRVRANEIRLYDHEGQLVYESPASVYKAGRYAPDWYAALVTPAMRATVIRVGLGTLMVVPNPTRAVLDGWDDLISFVASQAAMLLLAYLAMFWMMVRWLAPFEQIRRALLDIGSGRLDVRLPALKGKESGEMGVAFNRMADAVQDDIASRQQMAQVQARLAAQKDFTQSLHRRIDDERSSIARELHDEMGQSLTAIRSIAAALAQSPDLKGKPGADAARLLFETAGSTFDAMHRLIPRLRPVQLDDIGLANAVRDLAASLQQANPGLRIELQLAGAIKGVDTDVETCAYRILQEALTNVVRHAGASQARVALHIAGGKLRLTVSDNGCGAADPFSRAGHYGVRGMRERAEALGGELAIRPGPQGGLEVEACLPLQQVIA